MIFFSFISTTISSIFYGFLAIVVIMAVLYVVLRSIDRGIVQTPIFYITGVVLAILLFIQTTLMFGAMQAKDMADAAQQYVSEMIEGYQGIVNTDESQKVIENVTDEFPIIGKFVDLTSFNGLDVSDLPAAIHASIVDYLNSYLWRRVWWILGIVIVACAVVMLFNDNNASTNKSVGKAKTSSRKKYDDF